MKAAVEAALARRRGMDEDQRLAQIQEFNSADVLYTTCAICGEQVQVWMSEDGTWMKRCGHGSPRN